MNWTEFRLIEFQKIARWLEKKFPAPVAYFLKGWLWGLEEAYINWIVRESVTAAIEPLKPSEPPLSEPTHYTEPSDVDGLDIIGYSYEFTRTRNQDEGGLQDLPDTGVERTESPKAH